MVKMEQVDGFTVLQGRRKADWIIAPWWPCSGDIIRKVAADTWMRGWWGCHADHDHNSNL